MYKKLKHNKDSNEIIIFKHIIKINLSKEVNQLLL